MNHISELDIDSITAKMFTYDNYHSFKADTLYHATGEDIVGELRGGGYDGVLWTAYTPDVAQTYIPDAGSSTRYRKPSDYEMNDGIRISYINDFPINVARQMGYVFDIELDQYNRVSSYGCKKDGEYSKAPTYSELWGYLTESLGYVPDDDGMIDVKGRFVGGEYEYISADYKMPGKLYVISGVSQLKLMDISKGESDLTNLQYHKLDLFKQFESDGYDGVIIDDFCQTKKYGNLGHQSVGIFPSGISKLECRSIFATHHEWGVDTNPWDNSNKTSDFDPKALFDAHHNSLSLFGQPCEKEDPVEFVLKR